MESRTRFVPVKRVFAFIFDILFAAFSAFTIFLLPGLIISIESQSYQKLIYLLLILIFLYIFFGEVFLGSTLGKYLFGIEITDSTGSGKPSVSSLIKRGISKIIFPVEVFVLFISKSKKRLGDIWSQTTVLNTEGNKLKPYVRALMGVAILVILYFTFAVLVGFTVKRTDFYNAGVEYLKEFKSVKDSGLPTELLLDGNKVDFSMPVTGPEGYNYAKIYLKKTDDKWHVTNTEFFKGHLGVSFGMNLP